MTAPRCAASSKRITLDAVSTSTTVAQHDTRGGEDRIEDGTGQVGNVAKAGWRGLGSAVAVQALLDGPDPS